MDNMDMEKGAESSAVPEGKLWTEMTPEERDNFVEKIGAEYEDIVRSVVPGGSRSIKDIMKGFVRAYLDSPPEKPTEKNK